MKRFLLFALAVIVFAACSKDAINEQQNMQTIVDEAPETLTVGFEGDETRIQLNEAQKTVWTKGDLVSVFYRSNANQLWNYTGATGARTANLKRVDAGTATRDMDRVVVVYPYNEDYYINPSTFNVQASLPATQTYLPNSYGLDGNIMISSAEYNDVTLKNVCGWLKLQLTGDGEVVKSITFKGNNGEQVAGELYINSAEATAILASDMGNIAEDDGNNATGGAGANLSFDDVVLKEVTLDCYTGVTLGAEATAFYIALPPQTFDDGFTVEVACVDGSKMVKSSNKALSIERNHIQPMAEFSYTANISPSNVIWYTTSEGGTVSPKNDAFGVNILSNTYADGIGVITFDGDVTEIGQEAFSWNRTLTSITIPNTVKTIGVGAFYECSNLTNIIIPNSVATIEYEAFRYSAITKLTIGKNVTRVDAKAFANCINLTNLTVTNGTTVFGRDAFSECIGLTRVAIPNGITMSDNNIFVGCKNIEQFKGKQVIDNGRLIVLDNLLMSFAPSGLTSYTIPDSITVIGEGAFVNNDELISIFLNNNITTIQDSAFYQCSNLKSINIPECILTIESAAFYDCCSLTSVYCKATTPPALGGYAFDANGSGRKIYVPAGSVNAYKSAYGWSEYADAIVSYNFETGEVVE